MPASSGPVCATAKRSLSLAFDRFEQEETAGIGAREFARVAHDQSRATARCRVRPRAQGRCVSSWSVSRGIADGHRAFRRALRRVRRGRRRAARHGRDDAAGSSGRTSASRRRADLGRATSLRVAGLARRRSWHAVAGEARSARARARRSRAIAEREQALGFDRDRRRACRSAAVAYGKRRRAVRDAGRDRASPSTARTAKSVRMHDAGTHGSTLGARARSLGLITRHGTVAPSSTDGRDRSYRQSKIDRFDVRERLSRSACARWPRRFETPSLTRIERRMTARSRLNSAARDRRAPPPSAAPRGASDIAPEPRADGCDHLRCRRRRALRCDRRSTEGPAVDGDRELAYVETLGIRNAGALARRGTHRRGLRHRRSAGRVRPAAVCDRALDMFKKVLIANRGEIALRINRACHELGVSTVAIFSAKPTAVRCTCAMPTKRFASGPGPVARSYLNIPNIISTALICGADAIHPGYGFLGRERALRRDRARSRPHVHRSRARPSSRRWATKRRRASGHARSGRADHAGQRHRRDGRRSAQRSRDAIGYPVLLKATAGGGGKGMREVACGRANGRRVRDGTGAKPKRRSKTAGCTSRS